MLFRSGLREVSGVARRSLVVETVDGEPVLLSRWTTAFDYAGFRRDYRGFVSVPGAASPALAAAKVAPVATPAAVEADQADDPDELDDGGEDL